MLEKEFVYLACPYSDEDDIVRNERFRQVTRAAIHLMKQGHLVYSPITHCHHMQLLGELPTGWMFWSRMDKAYMRHCNTMFVLPLDGWDTSIGLTAERKYATEIKLPILYLDTNTYEIQWNWGNLE